GILRQKTSLHHQNHMFNPILNPDPLHNRSRCFNASIFKSKNTTTHSLSSRPRHNKTATQSVSGQACFQRSLHPVELEFHEERMATNIKEG
ncbi:hypothetical protein VNI00_019059, partial [Paramarasmius palmivorus]